MINSDGGSTDGTPELIRDATFSEADMVLTSHSLRTLHRVVAPYHGLPGKHAALRTVFAAAALTQAKALVVLDPAGPATSPERVTELITPITRAEVEFLTPRYRRHPRDGPLVTQLVRPLVRSLYGVALDEPLGAEFSCSGRFASHCLDQDMWDREAARFAIDLWLRAEAVAAGFALGQIWRPITASAGARASLREAVQQVVLALIESLRAHESFWVGADGAGALRTWGDEPATRPDAPSWDFERPGGAGPPGHQRRSGRCSTASSTPASSPASWRTCRRRCSGWPMSGGCGSSTRLRRRRVGDGRASSIWLACSSRSTCGVRRHSWRRPRTRPTPSCEARLDSLVQTFQRLKPVLVEHWSAAV